MKMAVGTNVFILIVATVSPKPTGKTRAVECRIICSASAALLIIVMNYLVIVLAGNIYLLVIMMTTAT